MNKLIELLNEYAPEDFNWCDIGGKIFDKDRCGTIMNVEMGVYVISKQFGFIKWLVENKKIDEKKIENSEYYLIDWFYYNERKKFGIEWKEDVEKIFLMLLSISDTPIDDLISYLK